MKKFIVGLLLMLGLTYEARAQFDDSRPLTIDSTTGLLDYTNFFNANKFWFFSLTTNQFTGRREVTNIINSFGFLTSVATNGLGTTNFTIAATNTEALNRKTQIDNYSNSLYYSSAAGTSNAIAALSVTNIAQLVALDTTKIAPGVTVAVAGYYKPNDGGGGLFVYDKNSTVLHDWGTSIKPTGANGRWLRQHISNVYPITWFGADNTCTNDSRNAVQAAFLVAGAAHGAVYVPAGDYLMYYGYDIYVAVAFNPSEFTGPGILHFSLPPWYKATNNFIYGGGTQNYVAPNQLTYTGGQWATNNILIFTNNFPWNGKGVVFNTCNGMYVHGLNIDGGWGSVPTGNQIPLAGITHESSYAEQTYYQMFGTIFDSTMSDNHLWNIPGSAFEEAGRSSFRGNSITNYGDHAFYFPGGTSNLMVNGNYIAGDRVASGSGTNAIYQTLSEGVKMRGTAYVAINGNIFNLPLATAFAIEAGATAPASKSVPTHDITISGNAGDVSVGFGFANYRDVNTPMSSYPMGVQSANIMISGNTFNCETYAARVGGIEPSSPTNYFGAAVNGVSFVGNTFSNNVQVLLVGNQLYTNGINRIDFSQNRFYSTPSTTLFRLSGRGNRLVLEGNLFVVPSTGGSGVALIQFVDDVVPANWSDITIRNNEGRGLFAWVRDRTSSGSPATPVWSSPNAYKYWEAPMDDGLYTNFNTVVFGGAVYYNTSAVGPSGSNPSVDTTHWQPYTATETDVEVYGNKRYSDEAASNSASWTTLLDGTNNFSRHYRLRISGNRNMAGPHAITSGSVEQNLFNNGSDVSATAPTNIYAGFITVKEADILNLVFGDMSSMNGFTPNPNQFTYLGASNLSVKSGAAFTNALNYINGNGILFSGAPIWTNIDGSHSQLSADNYGNVYLGNPGAVNQLINFYSGRYLAANAANSNGQWYSFNNIPYIFDLATGGFYSDGGQTNGGPYTPTLSHKWQYFEEDWFLPQVWSAAVTASNKLTVVGTAFMDSLFFATNASINGLTNVGKTYNKDIAYFNTLMFATNANLNGITNVGIDIEQGLAYFNTTLFATNASVNGLTNVGVGYNQGIAYFNTLMFATNASINGLTNVGAEYNQGIAYFNTVLYGTNSSFNGLTNLGNYNGVVLANNGINVLNGGVTNAGNESITGTLTVVGNMTLGAATTGYTVSMLRPNSGSGKYNMITFDATDPFSDFLSEDRDTLHMHFGSRAGMFFAPNDEGGAGLFVILSNTNTVNGQNLGTNGVPYVTFNPVSRNSTNDGNLYNNTNLIVGGTISGNGSGVTNVYGSNIVGGTIFTHFADVQNSGLTETDLYADTNAVSSLLINGQAFKAEYTVVLTNLVSSTTDTKVYCAGTLIYDTGVLTPGAAAGILTITVNVIRESSSVLRCSAFAVATGPTLGTTAGYSRLTGVTINSTNAIKITGTAAGVAGGTGDLTAVQGLGVFRPAN